MNDPRNSRCRLSRARRLLAALGAAGLGYSAPAGALAPAEVLILANSNVTASLELAEYYRQEREIPAGNLVRLDLPETEAVTRHQYEERLTQPLIHELLDRDLIREVAVVATNETGEIVSNRFFKTSLKAVVSVFGVPLRIDDSRSVLLSRLVNHWREPQARQTAAVDSELCLLLLPLAQPAGLFPNPLFRRLTPLLEEELGWSFLMATRLDGPDPDSIRRMIDGSLAAEKYGLLGRGYFDSRATRPGDTYALGDFWIREACERFLREGYECVLDREEAYWDAAFPLEQAAVYFGWYAEHLSGALARADMALQPGAVAYHIHSSSARTLRSAGEFWAGPLVARGAAVTAGAVHEPYLNFTPHLDVLADRLCQGFSVAEAAYMSLTHVSWQVSVVGDPLYRPFKLSLDEQIRNLEADHQSGRDWAYLRRINLLVREGRLAGAEALCRAKIGESDSLILREKLGDLCRLNDRPEEALDAYRTVADQTGSAVTAIRVGARAADILRSLNRAGEARQWEDDLRTRWKGHPVLAWLDRAVP